MKYYSLREILKRQARYNMVIGERSNGKTFAVQEYAIRQYFKDRSQLAIIRRWQDDFIGKRGQTMFDGVVQADVVRKASGGEWTDIYYHASRWYFCRYEDDKRIILDDPFAYGFAITSGEHDKSTSYPRIRTCLFDEFLTRKAYVPDEFTHFMNVLSTIIRQRDDVTIFMLGNTVNRYCPYFREMGLNHVAKMKPGDIDVYNYGSSGLRVAVEYAAPTKDGKPSDVYFAFDNPKLRMITGGSWELDIYPHAPEKMVPADIIYTFFIVFNDETLQCEIVHSDLGHYIFVHPKSTPIKDPEHDLIFTNSETSPRYNIRRNLMRPADRLGKKIAQLIQQHKVFYAFNDVGETFRNYLMTCKTSL